MWSLLTALPLGQPYSDLSLRLSLYIVNKCFSRLRCRGAAADSADRLFNDEDCLLVGVCRSGRLHPGPCRRRCWRRLLSAVRCVSPSFHPPFSLLRYDSQPWYLIPSTFLFAPVWQPTRRIPHSIHLSLLLWHRGVSPVHHSIHLSLCFGMTASRDPSFHPPFSFTMACNRESRIPSIFLFSLLWQPSTNSKHWYPTSFLQLLPYQFSYAIGPRKLSAKE